MSAADLAGIDKQVTYETPLTIQQCETFAQELADACIIVKRVNLAECGGFQYKLCRRSPGHYIDGLTNLPA